MPSLPRLLLTGGLCLASGYLAFLLVAGEMAPVIFWPPAGIALGAALIWGAGVIPAAFLGSVAGALLWGLHWQAAFLLGLAASVQALAGSLLLRHAGFSGSLASLDDLIRLLLHGGLLAGVAAAAMSYVALRHGDWLWEVSLPQGLLTLAMAHMLAALVFTPILLCRPTQTCPRPLGQPWEAFAALLLLSVVAVMLAHPDLVGLPAMPFRPYVLLPFLLWLALRAGPHHTAAGLALLYVVAVFYQGWRLHLPPSEAWIWPVHGAVLAIGTTFLTLAVVMAARRQAENALRASEARFRQLVENIQEVFWISENLRRFVYISPQCQEVTGLDPAELYADPLAWRSRLHPEDSARIDAVWQQIRAGRAIELEFRIQHPRKGTRWLMARLSSFEEGGVVMNAGVLEDVTARKDAAQARLAEVVEHKDALIREVHHRIKNNLQVVVGLLRRQAAQQPGARQAIEQAIAQVQSVALVHGLYGRANRHAILLCELLPTVVQSVSELTGARIVLDGVRPGSAGLRIKENETVAVALILNELLANALKHAAADGGCVSVNLRREGESGQILIGNAGTLPAGFDFQRGVRLGTGLSLVKALCPQSGMHIAYSESGGRVEVAVRIDAPVLAEALASPARRERPNRESH